MNRKILFILSVIVALFTQAQTSQVATLLHNGVLTNYYSGTALIDAYADAVDGDVITLSSGLFNSVDIEKNITIRGAGMGLTEAGDSYIPTSINSAFTIECPSSDTHHLTLEGLDINAKVIINQADNCMMSKCHISNLSCSAYSTNQWNNFVIIHSCLDNISPCHQSSISLLNCVIGRLYTDTNNTFSCMATNCIFDTNYADYHYNTSFVNCIISTNNSNKGTIHTSSTAQNCLLYNTSTINSTNKTVNSRDEIFTGEGFYLLTDEAKAFLGTDGTEVGIYGGSMPFSTTPSNPQITKFNVSPKTTADGKLSVDIEVQGAE